MLIEYAHSADRIQPAVIGGRTCTALTIRRGDVGDSQGNCIAGQDDQDRLYEGRNSKWHFAIYIPSWHQTPEPYKVAGIHSNVRDKMLDFHVYGETLRATVKFDIDGIVQPAVNYASPLAFDSWIDVSVGYRMSKGEDGQFFGDLNGQQFFRWRDKTMFSYEESTVPGRGPYAQLVLYDNVMPVPMRQIFIQWRPQLSRSYG